MRSMVTAQMWLHAVHDHRKSIFDMMYMWIDNYIIPILQPDNYELVTA